MTSSPHLWARHTEVGWGVQVGGGTWTRRGAEKLGVDGGRGLCRGLLHAQPSALSPDLFQAPRALGGTSAYIPRALVIIFGQPLSGLLPRLSPTIHSPGCCVLLSRPFQGSPLAS